MEQIDSSGGKSNMHPCQNCKGPRTKCELRILCVRCNNCKRDCVMSERFAYVVRTFSNSKASRGAAINNILLAKLLKRCNEAIANYDFLHHPLTIDDVSDLFEPCANCEADGEVCKILVTCKRCEDKSQICVPDAVLKALAEHFVACYEILQEQKQTFLTNTTPFRSPPSNELPSTAVLSAHHANEHVNRSLTPTTPPAASGRHGLLEAPRSARGKEKAHLAPPMIPTMLTNGIDHVIGSCFQHADQAPQSTSGECFVDWPQPASTSGGRICPSPYLPPGDEEALPAYAPSVANTPVDSLVSPHEVSTQALQIIGAYATPSTFGSRHFSLDPPELPLVAPATGWMHSGHFVPSVQDDPSSSCNRNATYELDTKWQWSHPHVFDNVSKDDVPERIERFEQIDASRLAPHLEFQSQDCDGRLLTGLVDTSDTVPPKSVSSPYCFRSGTKPGDVCHRGPQRRTFAPMARTRGSVGLPLAGYSSFASGGAFGNIDTVLSAAPQYLIPPLVTFPAVGSRPAQGTLESTSRPWIPVVEGPYPPLLLLFDESWQPNDHAQASSSFAPPPSFN